MVSKNEIKRIRALASKKGREESGLFAVEGVKSVTEAVMSAFEVEAVYCTSKQIADTIPVAGIRCEIVDENTIFSMTMLSTPSPAMAIVKIPFYSYTDELERALRPKCVTLALDSVRDPGNLGTILRIADWFGIDTVFASEDTVEVFNPKTVQASMGSIFRTKLIYCDLVKTAKSFTNAGLCVFGTFLDGEDIYRQTLPDEGLIVMGSESFGISKAVGNCITNRLLIPSFNRNGSCAESLNVAVATAIVCSEFRRKL